MKKAQSGLEPQRWEQDYELIECEGLFDEYLEIGKIQREGAERVLGCCCAIHCILSVFNYGGPDSLGIHCLISFGK